MAASLPAMKRKAIWSSPKSLKDCVQSAVFLAVPLGLHKLVNHFVHSPYSARADTGAYSASDTF